MKEEIRRQNLYYLEEKPIIELPFLLKALLIILCFALGGSLLFLPWYIVLILFTGLCFAFAIVFDPFIGVILFILTTFVHFLAFAPVGLVRYQPAVITGVVILLCWFTHVMVYRDLDVPRNIQLFYFLAFVLCFVFSVSFHQYDSYFHVLNLVKVLILYILIVILVKIKKQVLIILFLVLFLNIYSATYGIIKQHYALGGEVFKRIVGLEDNPNYFSMNLILIIPLILGFFQYYRSFWIKVFFATIFILLSSAVVFSLSRAGSLGLAIVVLFSFWRFFVKKNKFLTLFVFLLIFLSLIPFLPEEYWHRIQSIVNLKDVSIRGRIDGFLVGLQMMIRHPFIGTGIGRWAYEYWPVAITMPYVKTKFSGTAHNVFIEVGSGLGVFGLIVFIMLIYSSFKNYIIAQKIFIQRKELLLAVISDALFVGLIGFLSCAMFAAAVNLKIFWIIIALSVVLKRIALQLELEK